MKHKLSSNYSQLRNNCLFAMCAHIASIPRLSAISNERSWDGICFSFQSFDSTDGTIALDMKNSLIAGGLRKNTSNRIPEYPQKNALEYFTDAGDDIRTLAANEALQYLLMSFSQKKGFMEKNKPDTVVPVITTCFWNEGESIFSSDDEMSFAEQGGQFVLELSVSKEKLIEWLNNDYDLTADELEFAETLFACISSGKNKIQTDSFKKIVSEDSDIYDGFISALSSFNVEIE